MTRYRDLEGKINNSTDYLGLLSLGGIVLSGVLLFTPVKAVGYIGIGSSLGAFTASVTVKKKHFETAKQYIDSLTAQHKSALSEKESEIVNLVSEIKEVSTKLKGIKCDAKTQASELLNCQSQVQALTHQNESQKQLIDRVTRELDGLLSEARTAVVESLDEWEKRLTSLVNTKCQQSPKLGERLNQLLEEGQGLIANYGTKLSQTPHKWESLADLLSLYYCANDDLASVKTKCIKALGKLSTQEKEKDLDDWNESYQALEERYKLLLKEYRSKVDECNRHVIENTNNAKAIIEEFTVKTVDDVEANWKNATDFVQQLKGEIQRLEEKIYHLSKPLEWRPATRADMKVANIIIRYFEQLGVILDRAGTEYKGYEAKLWFLPDRTGRLVLADELNEHSDKLQALSHILNSPTFKLDPESGLINVTVALSKKPAIKEIDVSLMAGNATEFIDYITSHPIRYRLIADPGEGKTPTTAVMVSEILKVGGTRGNTGKGKKIPNMLVTVSCPDVESSQKDVDYPLEIFLKYGNTTSALKSIGDALDDWQYRKRDTNYADNFFQLWIWDELDNTLSSASDPKAAGIEFKKVLKQAHHTGVGWIVSGQSVMTSMIPGFMDDDRELFTQIIIGTAKIRKYLEKYGKKVLSNKVVNQLLENLDSLDPYIEEKNALITDAARLMRLALVLDGKSPKLYFLPNLDSAKFDAEKIESVITQADQMKRQFQVRVSGKNGLGLASEAQNAYVEDAGRMASDPPFLTIGGSDHSSPFSQIPHCPHCGGSDLKVIENGKRYQCKGCTKRFVTSKVVWK